jgi:inner membrane protein
MLAANAPDIDVFALFAGSYDAIAFRRGWTHGPVALALLPFILTALMLAWDRFVRRRRDTSRAPVNAAATLLIAVVGVVSHPALDWLNIYGIRLLMPYSGTWFYGDAIFILDPWLWLVLGLGLFLPRRTARRVQAFGFAALAYVVLMIGMSAAAESIAREAAAARGIADIEEVMYAPQPGRPLAGGLIVVTPTDYHFGDFSWLSPGDDRVRVGRAVIARGDWSNEAVRQAIRTEDVRKYLVWSRYPFVRTERVGDGTAVTFGDARFADGFRGGGLEGLRVLVH